MTKKNVIMTAELKIMSAERCEKDHEGFGAPSLTEDLLLGMELQPEVIRSQGHCLSSRLVTDMSIYLNKHWAVEEDCKQNKEPWYLKCKNICPKWKAAWSDKILAVFVRKRQKRLVSSILCCLILKATYKHEGFFLFLAVCFHIINAMGIPSISETVHGWPDTQRYFWVCSSRIIFLFWTWKVKEEIVMEHCRIQSDQDAVQYEPLCWKCVK